ncbi:unnamed protein product [Calicophoron daubneyi]|uniref:Uncharacterized protein n=1 Tax=Calicophoron daubneyi TaxID=300641 RepID=A0AAV2TGK2_CALDB
MIINRPLPPIPPNEPHIMQPLTRIVLPPPPAMEPPPVPPLSPMVPELCSPGARLLHLPSTVSVFSPNKEHFNPVFAQRRSRPRVPRMGTSLPPTGSSNPTTRLDMTVNYSPQNQRRTCIPTTPAEVSLTASFSPACTSGTSMEWQKSRMSIPTANDLAGKAFPGNITAVADTPGTHNRSGHINNCFFSFRGKLPKSSPICVNKRQLEVTKSHLSPAVTKKSGRLSDLSHFRKHFQRRLTPISERTNGSSGKHSCFSDHSRSSSSSSERSNVTKMTDLSLTWPLSRSQTDISNKLYKSMSTSSLKNSKTDQEMSGEEPNKLQQSVGLDKTSVHSPLLPTRSDKSTETGADNRTLPNWKDTQEWIAQLDSEQMMTRFKSMHLITLMTKNWTLKRRGDGTRYLAYRRPLGWRCCHHHGNPTRASSTEKGRMPNEACMTRRTADYEEYSLNDRGHRDKSLNAKPDNNYANSKSNKHRIVSEKSSQLPTSSLHPGDRELDKPSGSGRHSSSLSNVRQINHLSPRVRFRPGSNCPDSKELQTKPDPMPSHCASHSHDQLRTRRKSSRRRTQTLSQDVPEEKVGGKPPRTSPPSSWQHHHADFHLSCLLNEKTSSNSKNCPVRESRSSNRLSSQHNLSDCFGYNTAIPGSRGTGDGTKLVTMLVV